MSNDHRQTNGNWRKTDGLREFGEGLLRRHTSMQIISPALNTFGGARLPLLSQVLGRWQRRTVLQTSSVSALPYHNVSGTSDSRMHHDLLPNMESSPHVPSSIGHHVDNHATSRLQTKQNRGATNITASSRTSLDASSSIQRAQMTARGKMVPNPQANDAAHVVTAASDSDALLPKFQSSKTSMRSRAGGTPPLGAIKVHRVMQHMAGAAPALPDGVQGIRQGEGRASSTEAHVPLSAKGVHGTGSRSERPGSTALARRSSAITTSDVSLPPHDTDTGHRQVSADTKRLLRATAGASTDNRKTDTNPHHGTGARSALSETMAAGSAKAGQPAAAENASVSVSKSSNDSGAVITRDQSQPPRTVARAVLNTAAKRLRRDHSGVIGPSSGKAGTAGAELIEHSFALPDAPLHDMPSTSNGTRSAFVPLSPQKLSRQNITAGPSTKSGAKMAKLELSTMSDRPVVGRRSDGDTATPSGDPVQRTEKFVRRTSFSKPVTPSALTPTSRNNNPLSALAPSFIFAARATLNHPPVQAESTLPQAASPVRNASAGEPAPSINAGSHGMMHAASGAPAFAPTTIQRFMAVVEAPRISSQLSRPLLARNTETQTGEAVALRESDTHGEKNPPMHLGVERTFLRRTAQSAGTRHQDVPIGSQGGMVPNGIWRSSAMAEAGADAVPTPSTSTEPGPGSEATTPSTPPTMPFGAEPIGPGVLARIANEVYEMIEERLTVERESRGL